MLIVGLLFDVYLKVKNISLEHMGGRLSDKTLVLFVTIFILMISLFYSTSNNFIYFQF